MALTERIVEDKIEVVGDFKLIHVRTANIIERDGQEVTRTFHRHVVTPDMDVTNQSAEVQGIAAVVWTQELKDAYIASQAEEETFGEPTANTAGE